MLSIIKLNEIDILSSLDRFSFTECSKWEGNMIILPSFGVVDTVGFKLKDLLKFDSYEHNSSDPIWEKGEYKFKLPQFSGVLIQIVPEKAQEGWVCFSFLAPLGFILIQYTIRILIKDLIVFKFDIESTRNEWRRLFLSVTLNGFDCHPSRLENFTPMGSFFLSSYEYSISSFFN